MKNKTTKMLVVAAFMAVCSVTSTFAQSWGFTLPGGASFAYNGKGGPIGINSGGGWGGGGWGGGSWGGYGQPCGGPAVIYSPAPVIVRRTPPTFYTRNWVSYPNVW